MRFALVPTLLLVVICLSGCGSPTDTVKSGTLDMAPSVRVGQALDNYKGFLQREWREFETPQGRVVVEFRGVLDLDQYVGFNFWDIRVNEEWIKRLRQHTTAFQYIVQFTLNADGAGFAISYSGLEVTYADATEEEWHDFDLEMAGKVFSNKEAILVFHAMRQIIMKYENGASK